MSEDKAVAWLREVIKGNLAMASEGPAPYREEIARCEAELAILDRCAPPVMTGVARDVVRLLASGYRHRPGYAEHWGEAA